jgi:hypothetical protein
MTDDNESPFELFAEAAKSAGFSIHTTTTSYDQSDPDTSLLVSVSADEIEVQGYPSHRSLEIVELMANCRLAVAYKGSWHYINGKPWTPSTPNTPPPTTQEQQP